MKSSENLPPTLSAERDALQNTLLAWFAQHARTLPWRVDRTPYRVWIAEIMLQQTQVETVRDYYLRFLERFPTLTTLAAAPQEAVLKMWEGLGYYRRARALHQAAQQVLEQHGGTLPASVEALRALPGIGEYTAGAIASLAFGIAAPALDGNGKRVLSRLRGWETPTDAALRTTLAALLPEAQPGTFNEALMELGALVCRPQAPNCAACPWRSHCAAHASGTPTRYPLPAPRRVLPHYDVVAAVTLREDGRVLTAQRRQEDMLGGLWEFPGGKREAGETLESALRREMLEELGIEVGVEELLITIRHTYTHFRITLYAYRCYWLAGEPQCIACAAFAWVDAAEMRALPMAVTDQKIAGVVEPLLLKRET